MLKRVEQQKRTNENDIDEDESIIGKTKREFGASSKLNAPTLSRTDSGLKFKNINSHEKRLQVTSNKSNIPTKRQKTQNEPEVKKKPTTVDRTVRRREKDLEAEWEPENLDLDFSAFDDGIDEFAYQDNDLMEESSFERLFNKVKPVEEITLSDFPDTVEYGPPKEIEQPFEPEEPVDFTVFSDFADLDGYELIHLFEQDDFDTLTYPDYFNQLPLVAIDDTLEFSSEFSSLKDLEKFEDLYEDLNDDVYNPFVNSTFDIEHFIQCN